jgi:hypothetical protein
MSERDDRYVGNDGPRLPRNTGEFRATPDVSASTAQFKAFAAGQTSGTRPAADTGSWPEQPWDPGTSAGSGRTVWLVVGGIVVLVLVVVLILVVA